MNPHDRNRDYGATHVKRPGTEPVPDVPETAAPDYGATNVGRAPTASTPVGASGDYGATNVGRSGSTEGASAPFDPGASSGSIGDDFDVINDGALGSGGMGRIQLAWQKGLERWVAIKRMHPHDAADAFLRDLFGKEAKALAKLSHANIVQVFGTYVDEQGPYIVMEYVGGPVASANPRRPAPPLNLEQVVKLGPMPIETAIGYALQLCDALSSAHRTGIIHRDIKPANILLTAERMPKLTDFGLAMQVHKQTGPGMAEQAGGMGTPDYASPQQWADPASATRQDDVYSLAKTIWFMLTSQKHPMGEEKLSAAMIQTIERGLHDERTDRYATAEEFKAALQTLIKPADNLRADDRREGRCRHCNTFQVLPQQLPSGAVSCQKCHKLLVEPCLKDNCSNRVPVWSQFCKVCATDQTLELPRVKQKCERDLNRASELIHRHHYERAYPLLRQMSALTHSELRPFSDQAKTTLQQAEARQNQITTLRRAAINNAWEMMAKAEFSAIPQRLAQIPNTQWTPQVQRLIDEATVRDAEGQRVIEELARGMSACEKASERINPSGIVDDLRSRLNDYAKKIPHHDLNNLGDAITIDSASAYYIFRVKFTTIFDDRELIQGCRPHRGELVPARTVTADAVELWDYDLPYKSQNPVPSQMTTVAGSELVIVCSACSKTGKVVCPECNGSKQMVCSRCQGSTRVRCRDCDGTGDVHQEKTTVSEVPCPACGGRKVFCIKCKGRGMVESRSTSRIRRQCVVCRASGQIECPGCRARGSIVCPTCNGNAKVVCGNCEGGGRLIESCIVNQHFKEESYSDTFASEKMPEIVRDYFFDSPLYQEMFSISTRQLPSTCKFTNGLPALRNSLAHLMQREPAKDGPRQTAWQTIRVQRGAAYKVKYSFDKKEYVLWLSGADLQMHAVQNPVTSEMERMLREILKMWEDGDLRNAALQFKTIKEMAKKDDFCNRALQNYSNEIPPALEARSKIVWSVPKLISIATGGSIAFVAILCLLFGASTAGGIFFVLALIGIAIGFTLKH